MYAAENRLHTFIFSSIIHILPFPFLTSLHDLFFLTSICMTAKSQADLRLLFVFFFSIRIIRIQIAYFNQLFSAVKFIQSHEFKTFSLRFIFQYLYNRIFSFQISDKAARFHPSQRSKVRRWTPPSLSCYYALSTLKFHFQYIGMRMLQV